MHRVCQSIAARFVRLGGRRPSPSTPARSLAAALLALAVLAVAGTGVRGQVTGPRLGAALSILADGSAPWEDRPITIAGSGVLTGTAGVADPGDDLGPSDGVVRTFDSVAVRMSYDVLDAPAGGLTLVAVLGPELMWQSGEEQRLRLEGCPGGADVAYDRTVLTCRVGRLQVPPAVTGLVDAVARVRGGAPNGARPSIALQVTDAAGRPDPDPVRCPEALATGCRVTAQPLQVSAALTVDTRKYYTYSANYETRNGEPGWTVTWGLQVLAGGDGDLRGDAMPAPAPVTVHDWWTATAPDGNAVPAAGTLVSCGSTPAGVFQCAQPGGADSPIEVTIRDLDPDRITPSADGPTIVRYRETHGALAGANLKVFHPRSVVEAAGGSLRVRNCFATVPGDDKAAEFAPVDLSGAPNLGGLPERLSDNCAVMTLMVPEPPKAVGPDLRKRYRPGSEYRLEEVVAGEAFRSEVRFGNVCAAGLPDFQDVVLCDAFDNQTQRLVVDAEAGAAAWALALDSAGKEVRLYDPEAVVEYAAGPWGTWAAPGVSRGQAWYAQSTRGCADGVAVNPAGWVTAAHVDFGDTGQGRIDARDVNMVRVRLRDPVPSQGTRLLRSGLQALPNPPGTFLVNYGAGVTSTAPFSQWTAKGCYASAKGACPEPPALDSLHWDPGYSGDARILVEAPTVIRKYNVDGVHLLQAGEVARYRLEALVARDSAYPLTRDVLATSIVVTDVLPVGLAYLPGSAWRRGEDTNGNGLLDLVEDVNGNGVLDPAAPAPPVVLPDAPAVGQTTLAWALGPMMSRRNPAVFTFSAQSSKLIPGGRTLANLAEIRAAGEPPASCQGDKRYPLRCAAATVQFMNTSRAAVEKVALPVGVQLGQAVHFALRFANLTRRPIEWVDAVDILPWNGDGREPPSRLSAPWQAITATVDAAAVGVEVWASTRPPAELDVAGGGQPDGVMDPVTAYGAPGAGLGGADWPCLLADVGSPACPAIAVANDVTAVRIWAPDPDPATSGTAATSQLPVDEAPRQVDLWLLPERWEYGDTFHNAWGGRFEGLVLPAFDATVARVPPPTVYLPVVNQGHCRPMPVYLALVIDASTSMLRPSGLGGTKLDAVIDVAGTLADAVLAAAPSSEVAVIAFNDRGWVALPRGSDPAGVRRTLADLRGQTAQGTRLDLGLALGSYALDGTPPRGRTMIFLTDGMPNRVPTPIPAGSQEDAVLQIAKAVRARGIVIHAVGYGDPDAPELVDRVSPTLLAAIAGEEGSSWIAPDAARLMEVFGDLRARLVCPTE